jgi:hypothetical protein
MNISTENLEGSALDWAVAKVMGHKIADNCYRDYIRIHLPNPKQSGYTMAFCPSTDWALGGAIIEREEISIHRNAPSSKGREWEAMGSITAKGAGYTWGYGATPLIAAMRCYVKAQLGDVVDVPNELTY